jgi:hypothetical protein
VNFYDCDLFGNPRKSGDLIEERLAGFIGQGRDGTGEDEREPKV